MSLAWQKSSNMFAVKTCSSQQIQTSPLSRRTSSSFPSTHRQRPSLLGRGERRIYSSLILPLGRLRRSPSDRKLWWRRVPCRVKAADGIKKILSCCAPHAPFQVHNEDPLCVHFLYKKISLSLSSSGVVKSRVPSRGYGNQ